MDQSRPWAPWYAFVVNLAGTAMILGIIWDVSWHSTIGRDTFWSPPHFLVYLGGLTAGLTGGWLALRASFWGRGGAPGAEAVELWGFRAPLGAWVAIWGAAAMLVSAPFDDWWHNAYGLDVLILSPPHLVLILGMMATPLGGLLLVAGSRNRTGAVEPRGANGLLALGAGTILTMAMTFTSQVSQPNVQHTAGFYLVGCLSFPVFLAASARLVRSRWPVTTAAAVGVGLILFMGWILPLFPAEPRLAPIRNPLSYMSAPPFPPLLIAPAIVMDLLMRGPGRGRRGDWVRSMMLGAAFLAVFLPVQWIFSIFLIAPAAENRLFFGSGFFNFWEPPGPWMHQFWRIDRDPVTVAGTLVQLAIAVLATRVGLAVGRFMARVER